MVAFQQHCGRCESFANRRESLAMAGAGSRLLGIDHKRLTCFHHGRKCRLTDVAGRVLQRILG